MLWQTLCFRTPDKRWQNLLQVKSHRVRHVRTEERRGKKNNKLVWKRLIKYTTNIRRQFARFGHNVEKKKMLPKEFLQENSALSWVHEHLVLQPPDGQWTGRTHTFAAPYQPFPHSCNPQLNTSYITFCTCCQSINTLSQKRSVLSTIVGPGNQ